MDPITIPSMNIDLFYWRKLKELHRAAINTWHHLFVDKALLTCCAKLCNTFPEGVFPLPLTQGTGFEDLLWIANNSIANWVLDLLRPATFMFSWSQTYFHPSWMTLQGSWIFKKKIPSQNKEVYCWCYCIALALIKVASWRIYIYIQLAHTSNISFVASKCLWK